MKPSSSSNGNCQNGKFGSYGTFLFPEQKAKGFWRLQTDFKPLLKVMKKRGWDKESPWETVGWGTSYIFRREFYGTYEAKRSVERVLAKLGYPDVEFIKLELGGCEIVRKAETLPTIEGIPKKPVSDAFPRKTPPLSGKNQERALDKSSEREGVFR